MISYIQLSLRPVIFYIISWGRFNSVCQYIWLSINISIIIRCVHIMQLNLINNASVNLISQYGNECNWKYQSEDISTLLVSLISNWSINSSSYHKTKLSSRAMPLRFVDFHSTSLNPKSKSDLSMIWLNPFRHLKWDKIKHHHFFLASIEALL